MNRIPTNRILEKAESYYAVKDTAGAERHLLYWLGEAQAEGDLAGAFQMHSELMGHYRKGGKKDEAYLHAEKALELLSALRLEESVTAGTAHLNVATVYQNFGDSERAVLHYEKAKRIYEAELPKDDLRMGGLYNNMGICLSSLHRFAEGKEAFEKAISLARSRPDGKPEEAITYLNLCDLLTEEMGGEESETEVSRLLDKAWECLTDPSNRQDGYFAFVCEKCASGFGYYGRFSEEAELTKTAGRIYGTRT